MSVPDLDWVILQGVNTLNCHCGQARRSTIFATTKCCAITHHDSEKIRLRITQKHIQMHLLAGNALALVSIYSYILIYLNNNGVIIAGDPEHVQNKGVSRNPHPIS